MEFTLVKCRGALFFVNLPETVYDALVLGIMKGLIDEPNFDDFEGLHDKDLDPSRNASGKEVLESVHELAHF